MTDILTNSPTFTKSVRFVRHVLSFVRIWRLILSDFRRRLSPVMRTFETKIVKPQAQFVWALLGTRAGHALKKWQLVHPVTFLLNTYPKSLNKAHNCMPKNLGACALCSATRVISMHSWRKIHHCVMASRLQLKNPLLQQLLFSNYSLKKYYW